MKIGTFTIHRRAWMTLTQLTEAEQKRVTARLEALSDIPVVQWPPAWVKPIGGIPPLYLVKIDDSLRGFVHAEEDQQLELVDLVRRETLVELFSKSAGKNGD